MLSKQVSDEITKFVEGYDKLLILGIGNTMRGDDGLGPKLLDKLYDELIKISDKDTDNVYLLNCATAPENYTLNIRQIEASHIIIVDAVEFDTTPGEILIINKKQVDTFNLSTHTMPISFLIKYIEETIGGEVLTIGIQPKQMELIEILSEEVIESIDELTDLFVKLV